MIRNRYITGLLITALLSSVGVALVLTQINPENNGTLGLLLFFPTFFLAAMSIFSLLGFWIRALFFTDAFMHQIAAAIRQGILLSLLANFSLVLSIVNAFNWLTGLVLVLIIVVLEVYFARE